MTMAVGGVGTSIQEFTARLTTLKNRAEALKTERTRGEAALEQLNRQEQEIAAEVQGLGITPEDLEAELQRLDAVVAEGIQKAESLLAE